MRLRWPWCQLAGVALVSWLAAGVPPRAAAAADDKSEPIKVTITPGTREKAISPDLVGIFFEDLNDAADGGLYAELIRNRSFEFSTVDNNRYHPLLAWDLLLRGDNKASIEVGTKSPLHEKNQHFAIITVERHSGDDGVRLTNEGFGGIAVRKGEQYNLSFYARRLDGRAGVTSLRLENKLGAVIAEANAPALGDEWAQHKAVLQPTADADDAKLVLCIVGQGKVGIDMVSLFPQKTFRNRPNGLRADLGQCIADLKPRFMRFPGGCLAHGRNIDNMYRWKDTIGPVEQRKGKPNMWGYHQSFGLGYFEYFQFCEDIGATPIPVLAAGVTCQFQGQKAIPMSEMGAWAQDFLDLIEYANGPVTSKWGAKRAEAGHPQPFNLRHIAIGNEDAITPEFIERFKLIYQTVKARHPEIILIGTSGPFVSGPDYDKGWGLANELKMDMVDEHYYLPPAWFLNNNAFYDRYPRDRSKVYLGEYAAHEPKRGSTLRAALAEAAYLTALERNGDIVAFASYAPLLGKLGRTQWNPNLIYFTNSTVVPTPSYYVQQLFGTNAGDRYIRTIVAKRSGGPQFGGQFFLGTWDTHAEFDDVQLVSKGEQAFSDEFEGRVPGNSWSPEGGRWAIENGVYRQTKADQPALSRIKPPAAGGDFRFKLRARKLHGSEGFLIGFASADPDNYYWWNLGGWANTRHSVEKALGGVRKEVTPSVPGRIERDRWYEISVESVAGKVKCHLDGKLIHEFDDRGFDPQQSVFASTVRDSKSGDVIFKAVNTSNVTKLLQLHREGVETHGPVVTKIVLAGDVSGVNTVEAPNRIVPVSSTMAIEDSQQLELPAHSVTVIRLKANRAAP